MSHHDLRGFLARLERERQLARVAAPVDPHLESTALCLRALREGGPALLMERPHGSRHALLGNLFGHRRRIEMAMADRPIASLRELGRLLASIKEPRWPSNLRQALAQWPELAQLAHVAPQAVREAAFLDETLEGTDVDLSRLPIQHCWPDDAGKLVTLGLVVTRGTRQTRQNVAIYRQQVIGRNRVIMRWLPHRGGALDHADWRSAHPQRPFPLLVAIGVDPATLLAAVAPVPDTLSEYEFAGLLRGRRTRLWRSALTGLDAPASAEIVLEGTVSPAETAVEGPFGDHTGYYNAPERYPVFTLSRLRIRDGASYLTTFTGRAPDEPSVLGSALLEVFKPLLRAQMPEVVDVWLPPEACSYRIAVIAIAKTYAGQARRVMMGFWSTLPQFSMTKMIVVVDDDIDIRSWPDVMWALATRMDPGRDVMQAGRMAIDQLDFASPLEGLGGKMGLDATRKIGAETSREWGVKLGMDAAVERRVGERWDELFPDRAAHASFDA